MESPLLLVPSDVVLDCIFAYCTPADVYMLTRCCRALNRQFGLQVPEIFKRDLRKRLVPFGVGVHIFSPGVVLTGSMVIQVCQGLNWPGSDLDIFTNSSSIGGVRAHLMENPRAAISKFDYDYVTQAFVASEVWQSYDDPQDAAVVFTPSHVELLPRLPQGTPCAIFVASHNPHPVNLVSYVDNNMPRKFNFDLGICNGRFDGKLLEIPATWNTFRMISKINMEPGMISGEPSQLRRAMERVAKYERRGVTVKGVADLVLAFLDH